MFNKILQHSFQHATINHAEFIHKTLIMAHQSSYVELTSWQNFFGFIGTNATYPNLSYFFIDAISGNMW